MDMAWSLRASQRPARLHCTWVSPTLRATVVEGGVCILDALSVGGGFHAYEAGYGGKTPRYGAARLPSESAKSNASSCPPGATTTSPKLLRARPLARACRPSPTARRSGEGGGERHEGEEGDGRRRERGRGRRVREEAADEENINGGSGIGRRSARERGASKKKIYTNVRFDSPVAEAVILRQL